MKDWTEPNGILIMHIPVDWQYLNTTVKGEKEISPYSFQPYNNSIGCFQLSCYPLAELASKIAKKNPNGVKDLSWRESVIYDSDFCAHIYHGALGDQALIAKYIYELKFINNPKIKEQLELVKSVLNTIIIIPEHDRSLAANLNKYDRFFDALAASHDLLNAAIESTSFIEIIAISANQIDAYLRLSIVIAKQIASQTDEFDVRYFFQADNEWGIKESKIYELANNLGIIDNQISDELAVLYKHRNRVIHRYIISNIKTQDLMEIALSYLENAEKIRLILEELENKQFNQDSGIYGKKLYKSTISDTNTIQTLYARVNDKHQLSKFSRSIILK